MTQESASFDAAAKSNPTRVIELREQDLPEAQRIFRLAFGTFFGAPEPERFWSDRDYLRGRHRARHVASFGALLDGTLVGSNFATNWGSVGFFGPLTVRPDLQERGIGQALLAKTMEQFDAWATRQVGLFTFAHSAKHVALYQKFGFYPRFLTAIMSRPIAQSNRVAGLLFSELTEIRRKEALAACRLVTETLYSGLDLSGEIGTTLEQGLGDVVLVEDNEGLTGFAVCHYGRRSEAGANTCLVKFGAVRDTAAAERNYSRLLDASEALGSKVGMANLVAGANLARQEAYQNLVGRGFRALLQGVGMHRHNDPGYCRPGVYIIDDWR